MAEPEGGSDNAWRRVVDKIIRGERPNRDYLEVAATPAILTQLGFSSRRIVMTPGKLARCKREHPEVTLAEIYRLPELIGNPVAAFPSRRDDGSFVLLLIVQGTQGQPIIAAILPGEGVAPNVILSVYGKEAGLPWVWQQIDAAEKAQRQIWMKRDFAATQPQPGSAFDASPSPSGLIPASGATKPKRDILTMPSKVKDSPDEALGSS